VLLKIVTLCRWGCRSRLFDCVTLRMKVAKSFETSRTTRPATRRHIAQVFILPIESYFSLATCSLLTLDVKKLTRHIVYSLDTMGCPNKSARFTFVINAQFIQNVLIF
jgi:hypothetical protein